MTQSPGERCEHEWTVLTTYPAQRGPCVKCGAKPDSTQAPRDWWIAFPENYPSGSDKLATVDDIPLGDGIHVIEYKEVERLRKALCEVMEKTSPDYVAHEIARAALGEDK